jgi:hypothetical protein
MKLTLAVVIISLCSSHSEDAHVRWPKAKAKTLLVSLRFVVQAWQNVDDPKAPVLLA